MIPSQRPGSGHLNDVMLKQLGEVTVLASRIEHLAAGIAQQLRLKIAAESADPTDSASSALAVLSDSAIAVPPWSTIEAADVRAWAVAATRLIEVRDRMSEASGGARFLGSRGDTIPTESPDGTTFPADEEYLARYLKRIARHLAAGVELQSQLDYHDEKGQRWPLVSIYAQRTDELSSDDPALRLPPEWERWLSA
ncbi:hypothetical protein ACFPJ4_01620 [Lysinimonas soli]|uniref:Uncharacterized protein n=1 Tax=Lysinimonas soli TaxID=1074233 RepID=A0ABW0NP17_9MICO